MIPADLDYRSPASLDEALTILAATPEAKVLGGGMSLLPALKHRLVQPAALVDLGRIPGLGGVALRDGQVVIGGCATHSAVLASAAAKALPVLREAGEQIGDLQVRNRGTFAGSLVHADPAADWPAVFLALEGEAEVAGRNGRRTVAAGEFFTGMMTSAVAADEILTEVRLSAGGPRSGSAYGKLRQPASGFALVGVAANVQLDGNGRIAALRVGVTGVNAVPFRATSLEERLAGQMPDRGTIRGACEAPPEADAMEDLHASAEYRLHLLTVIAARTLARACERAAA